MGAHTDESLMIRELILQLKTGQVDSAYFLSKFGVKIMDRFREAIAGLRRDGFLHEANGELRLNRQGILRVDALLPRFFEDAYRDIRYT